MAFTEFRVSKEASVSDVNGGGPSFGADDVAVATYANVDATHSAGGLHTLDNNNGGAGWGATGVDDFLCYDTAVNKEFGKVTALSVGGDDDVIEVQRVDAALAFSDLTSVNVNVGGAWATVDHALSTVTVAFRNGSSHPPRINLKYNAAAYSEYAVADNTGGATVRIRLEGYEATAGDGCPNDNLPEVNDGAGGGVAVISLSTMAYWDVVNIKAVTAIAGDHAFYSNASHCRFVNCHGKATGANGDEKSFYFDATHGSAIGCWSEDSTDEGFYGSALCVYYGCIATSAGTFGFTQNSSTDECVYIGCIADTCADDGFYIKGEAFCMIGCVGYKSTAGSGVRLFNANDYPVPFIVNCIFSENNQFGIECNSTSDGYHILNDYNAFYNNAQGEVSNLPNRGFATGNSNEVTLTGDPFTAAATRDFTLDNTANEGAACRDAGDDAQDGIGSGS